MSDLKIILLLYNQNQCLGRFCKPWIRYHIAVFWAWALEWGCLGESWPKITSTLNDRKLPAWLWFHFPMSKKHSWDVVRVGWNCSCNTQQLFSDPTCIEHPLSHQLGLPYYPSGKALFCIVCLIGQVPPFWFTYTQVMADTEEENQAEDWE